MLGIDISVSNYSKCAEKNMPYIEDIEECKEKIFDSIFSKFYYDDFRNVWDKQQYLEKIEQATKEDIKNQLLISAYCRDIYSRYKSDALYGVSASQVLTIIKKNISIPPEKRKTYQNSHLIDKGRKNAFLFPYPIPEEYTKPDQPLLFPKYFDKFSAYFLIGMYIPIKKEECPVYIYKHNIKDTNYIPYFKDILYFCSRYHNHSIKSKGITAKRFSLIDDYLFENEFNHILTLDIIQIIRTMEDKLSKSEIDLIEFTLSFLSLLPLYTKTAFIKLFLDLVFEGYYQLFDADWANNCISAVINFAFVSIPLMEECHYMLLKKNGAISCDLSMLNEKYKLNLEHIEDLKPTNPIVPLEIYSRIQNYISLIKTVFGDDIYDSVIKIKEYKTEIDIPDDNGNTRSIEVPEIGINSYSIINSVFSILNGNLNNYIDESYSASNSEKAFFRKRLEANEALSNLYRRHIIEKF